MPFTIKKLFGRVDLPEDQLREHRFKVGISIKNSWWNRTFTNTEKIEEDGFSVCVYPDQFERYAKRIADRYITGKALPLKPKRKRVNTVKVNTNG